MKIECHWEWVRGESYQTTIRQLSLSLHGVCRLRWLWTTMWERQCCLSRKPRWFPEVQSPWSTPLCLEASAYWSHSPHTRYNTSLHTHHAVQNVFSSLFLMSLFCLFVQDHDFFQHLEMHMRSEFPPLCGRDHLSFRSYYFPVKVAICWSCFYMSFHLFQTCISGSLPVRDLEICPESFFLSSVFLSRMW